MKRIPLRVGAGLLLMSLAVANLTLANPGPYYSLWQWGTDGTADGQFKWPHGIAVAPNDDVYVTDLLDSRIQCFTHYGVFRWKWGSTGTGDGQLNWGSPAIAVNSNGVVYVADPGNYRVQYFTSTGSFLGKWGTKGRGSGQFDGLCALAVAPTSRDVYTVENWDAIIGDHDAGYRVQRFSETGQLLNVWPVVTNLDTFWPPHIYVIPDGTVYLGFSWDTHSGTITPTGLGIHYYTPDGVFKGAWGEYGGGAGQFQDVRGLGYSAFWNSIFVTDMTGRVQVFTPTGSYITEWLIRGNEDYWLPSVAAASRNVYVCETETSSVQCFSNIYGVVPP